MKLLALRVIPLLATVCLGVAARADDNPVPTTDPATTAPADDAREQPVSITHAEVEKVIQKAVAYIYSKQNAAGNWESTGATTTNPGDNNFGGFTAISVYALLAAGEPRTSAKLKPAIEWLRKAEIRGTYAMGMRVNAYAYLPPEQVAPLVRLDAQTLVKGINKPEAQASGLYDYSLFEPDPARVDHSVSQVGVLGAWMAAQLGADVPSNYWLNVEKAWLRDQQWSGGWRYGTGGDPVTGALTAAGVATLFITQEHLHASAGLACQGNIGSPGIDEGLRWLSQHFKASSNPGDNGAHDAAPYWLYAAERVGAAGGLKYFGRHDWFAEGAAALKQIQRADGAFFDPGRANLEDIPNTCFGILFLARGRNPVLINKLRYDGSWNQRPRDAANFVRWVGRQYEREYHWQVVGIDRDVREFHDAPVLLITGGEDLAFNDDQKAKLKKYVEQGGLILGHADCANPTFVAAFQRLGTAMFPSYQWRILPADHPLHSEFAKPDPKRTRTVQVMGLSNGVRELMLLLPEQDPGRSWQINKPKAEPSHFEVAANILFYASDRLALRYKLDPFLPRRNESADQSPAGRTIRLARLQYDGNWDPEPGGWQRQSVEIQNRYGARLTVSPIPLGKGVLLRQGVGSLHFPIAHLTGTGTPKFSEAQVGELKKFVEAGGTLLVDAAGGDTAFGQAFENELVPKITADPVKFVAAEDRLFAAPSTAAAGESAAGDAASVVPLPVPVAVDVPAPAPPAASTSPGGAPFKVEYRRSERTRKRVGNLRELRIKGVQVNGRWAILFSNLDLSAGLVGQNIDGIVGYAPETAATIVRRILINAAPPR